MPTRVGHSQPIPQTGRTAPAHTCSSPGGQAASRTLSTPGFRCKRVSKFTCVRMRPNPTHRYTATCCACRRCAAGQQQSKGGGERPEPHARAASQGISPGRRGSCFSRCGRWRPGARRWSSRGVTGAGTRRAAHWQPLLGDGGQPAVQARDGSRPLAPNGAARSLLQSPASQLLWWRALPTDVRRCVAAQVPKWTRLCCAVSDAAQRFPMAVACLRSTQFTHINLRSICVQFASPPASAPR
jgi:hypothetical protein